MTVYGYWYGERLYICRTYQERTWRLRELGLQPPHCKLDEDVELWEGEMTQRELNRIRQTQFA